MSNSINLIPAKKNAEDAKIIMNWRNDKDTLKASLHQTPKVWPNFFEEYLSSYFPHLELPPLFGLIDGEKFGFIRLEPCSHPLLPGIRSTLRLSIMLAPEFRGKGLGKSLLIEATNYVLNQRTEDIFAEVLLDNERSFSLFNRVGYKYIGKQRILIEDLAEFRNIHAFYLSNPLKKNIETLLIDFDGTFVDNIQVLYNCFDIFLKNYDLEATWEEFYKLNGYNIIGIVTYLKENYSLLKSVEELKEEYLDLVHSKYLTELKLFPNSTELLDELNFNRISSSIVSASPKKFIQEALKNLQADHLIEKVFSATETKRSKPFPDVYLKALSETNTDHKNAIAIEDSESGLESANTAKIATLYFQGSWNSIYSTLWTDFLLKSDTSRYYKIDLPKEITFSKTLEKMPLEIEDQINKLFQEGQQKNPHLTDGTIYSFKKFSKENIQLFEIPYRYYYAGLNSPEIKELLFLRTVGVTGITKHKNRYLIGKRADFVSQYPSYYELAPSGGLDPSCKEGKLLNVEKQLLSELEEETHFTKEQVDKIEPTGIYFDAQTLSIDFIYTIELKSTESLETSPSEEYPELLWVPEEELDNWSKNKPLIPLLKSFLTESHF